MMSLFIFNKSLEERASHNKNSIQQYVLIILMNKSNVGWILNTKTPLSLGSTTLSAFITLWTFKEIVIGIESS